MRKPYYKISILLFLFLTACGSNHLSSTDTGSISFNLKLSHPTTMSRSAAAISADICDEYGITDINVNLFDSSHKPVTAGHWSCKALKGTLSDIPAGENYTIEITGTVAGVNAWSGKKIGVGVTAGETTTTGIIMMDYTGNDKISPIITSTTPSSDPEAVSVPVTSMITAKFSEKMAASTINDSTFKLNNGTEPVSGSVVYDSSTRSAEFRPSNILFYLTTYTATLTTDIEDMAGKKMESVYEWRFTTEEQPLPDTIPEAPASLIAASGNSQIKIMWDAVPAATSYNIYWSETSGVTKANAIDTKISGITTTSYTHTNLTNGTNYFYVVTSENNSYSRESVESIEIASAPGSIDANPPTASVIINDYADFTNSTVVTLLLLSSSTRGISQMCISNTTTCSSWEPYTTSKSWQLLTTGDGLKFVYAWFKDSSGTSNAQPYVDTITLDTTPP